MRRAARAARRVRRIRRGLGRSHRASFAAQYRPHAEGDAANEEKHEQEPSHDRAQALEELLGLRTSPSSARVPSESRRGAGGFALAGTGFTFVRTATVRSSSSSGTDEAGVVARGRKHGDGCRARSRPRPRPQRSRPGPLPLRPRRAWGPGASAKTARFEARGRTHAPTGSAALGLWTSRSRGCVQAPRARRCG